jgi:hypothetical protein
LVIGQKHTCEGTKACFKGRKPGFFICKFGQFPSFWIRIRTRIGFNSDPDPGQTFKSEKIKFLLKKYRYLRLGTLVMGQKHIYEGTKAGISGLIFMAGLNLAKKKKLEL